MKTILLSSVLLAFALAYPARAFLIKAVYVADKSFYVSSDQSSAQSDQVPDNSTVEATLKNYPDIKRWELRFNVKLTGSEDLVAGSDVTTGSDLKVQLYTYPVGNPQYFRGLYLHGQNLNYVDYSPTANTIELRFQPVMPVISANQPGGLTAVAGLDIFYSGVAQNPAEINYGPPIIVGDMICTDVTRAQHPSSAMLHGEALNFNGVNGQMGHFQFYLGERHAAHAGYDASQLQAYVDGTQPATDFGFTTSMVDSSASINLGDPTESFWECLVYNGNWSAHDIQVGHLPAPLKFIGIQKELDGVRVLWNADTNKTYTLEYFDELGGTTNVLGTNLQRSDFLDTDAPDPARFYRLREE